MPKIRRERVRRHTAAAGSLLPSKEEVVAEESSTATQEKASLLSTGAGIVWEPVKPLDLSFLTSPPSAKQQDTLMTDSKNDSSSSSSSSSNSSSSNSGSGTGSEEKKESHAVPVDGKRVAKKQTKKEKIQARHEKFMNRLMLPGEKQKFEEKKLDLSALADVIDSSEPAPVASKMTSHTRKSVAASEINQFKLVFQHPAFQQDALSAIREHLQISIAAREEEAQSGPTKPKKQANRHHPYAKSVNPSKPEKERASKPAQASQKPNPNKGKHTRKKGRAETIRKR